MELTRPADQLDVGLREEGGWLAVDEGKTRRAGALWEGEASVQMSNRQADTRAWNCEEKAELQIWI